MLVSTSAGGQEKTFKDDMAERTRACTACHGAQGKAGPDGYYPRLAGKPTGYLFNQLKNFQEGRRHYNLMTRLVDPLSDAYLKEIADYFANLKLPYPPAARPPERVSNRLLLEGKNWPLRETAHEMCLPVALATARNSQAFSPMCPVSWACRLTI